jgi:hypothetical protein
VKTVAVRKFNWAGLLGCCLALWLAGCAPRIYETPYVPPPLPAPPPPPAVSRPVYYVSASRLNLRGCAGMDCPKISVLEQNEAVEKLGEMDDWFEVIVTRDGRRGWVTSRYLSPEPVAPTPEAPPAVEAPPPAPEAFPAPPPPVEKPPPAKPPVVEKPKPIKPELAPAPPKKKTEEARPAKPGEPARKPAPPPEKAAPPKEKPAPPEKPTPPKQPESEQPKSIRIM